MVTICFGNRDADTIITTLNTSKRSNIEMFKPVNKTHAIIEVHFVLDVERPWLPEDQPLIDKGYEEYWRDVLPARVQGQSYLMNFGPRIQGPGMGAPPNPMVPLFYNAVSRDGSSEWELAFEGNQIRITCGKYSRWDQVWKVAGNLFQMAGKSLNERDTGIVTAELTYLDLFVWEGEEKDYDVKGLLTHEQGVIGSSVAEHGPLWHSQQGWIRDQKDWPEENYLERIHLNANKGMIGQEEKLGVLITTTTRLGHGGRKKLFSLQRGFNPLQSVKEKPDDGKSRFEWLHTQAKTVFSRVLTSDAQDSIGLWAK